MKEILTLIAIALLAIPFGIIVYRFSDSDPIPLKYAKLSGVAVAFAMVSMLTMPITTGHSYWGYASASPDSELPQPNDSLYFDTIDDNLTIKGALTITDGENSAISLDGTNDYLVLDSSLSEKLESFTVSAWVKPDYKKGAPATLSIASSADAFELAINNDKIDENIAIFSVYDGIKWHQVKSKTAISEQWTHISATYSDETLKIFVNGAQEGSKGELAAGSTRRGIGPCYSDKVARFGIRICDLLDEQVLSEKLDIFVPLQEKLLAAYGENVELSKEDLKMSKAGSIFISYEGAGVAPLGEQ